jgi:ABC-2 type transport system ATP-binding protein
MITGLLDPTSGQVLFEGESIRHDPVAYKRRLGYVPEEAHLYPHLTGFEYLELVGLLRQIPADILRRKIDSFLDLLLLSSYKHALIASYSKGMRQRILISAALLHDPDVVVFDEPLSGLDVTTALVFRKLVKRLAADGKAILYSSHVLEVVEKVCSHVLVLYKGHTVAHSTIEEVGKLASKPSLEAVFMELTQIEDTDQTADGLVDAMKFA